MSPSSARLALSFDAGALQDDLDGLGPGDWVPHFNTGYYEGDWSGAALRSVGGTEGRLYPDPTARERFADTPLLDRCPAASGALESLGCPLLAARFLRVGPGSRIRKHTDLDLSVEDGEVRLHVPVVSNPDVVFLLDGSRVEMGPGEVWYLNFNLPHAVENRGSDARVHLVVDCVVNDWLRDLILAGWR